MEDTVTVSKQSSDYLIEEDHGEVLLFDLQGILNELNTEELQRLES